MSNDKSVNHAEIVAWFVRMRQMGFKIAEVGHDRKFCREYFAGMKKAGFKIIDQPQYFYKNLRALGTSRRLRKTACCTTSTPSPTSTASKTCVRSKRRTT